MSQYIPKPLKNFGENINVRVDLSNYATETDFKNWKHTLILQGCNKCKFSLFENWGWQIRYWQIGASSCWSE